MKSRRILSLLAILSYTVVLCGCTEKPETDPFGISDNTVDFPDDGGEKSIVVNTPHGCTLSCDGYWVTFSPKHIEAGTNTVTVAAAANMTTESRQAIVTISDDKSGVSGKIIVNQAASTQPQKYRMIIYTTDDNQPTPVKASAFDANITEHTYENGTGTIIFDNPVTLIGERAFEARLNLTSIKIPNSVTEIGRCAFYNCRGLTNINIPNSVTTIGHLVFCECMGLTSVKIPNSVTNMGGAVFSECSSLTSVTISNNITAISGSTFQNCTSLTSVTIPDGVTSIGEGAFMNCISLKSITIPNSVTTIEKEAFYNCTNLTGINIPDGITTIEKNTFSDCTNLPSVNIPDSVTEIKSGAFSGCATLTKSAFRTVSNQ